MVPRVFRAPEGPAAREARASLRSVPRLEARPGPPDPPAPSTPVGPVVLMRIHIIAEPTPNFACNSPETISNLEFRSLELQRFQTSLKLLPIELHATFLGVGLDTTTGTVARPIGVAAKPHPNPTSLTSNPPSAHR